MCCTKRWITWKKWTRSAESRPDRRLLRRFALAGPRRRGLLETGAYSVGAASRSFSVSATPQVVVNKSKTALLSAFKALSPGGRLASAGAHHGQCDHRDGDGRHGRQEHAVPAPSVQHQGRRLGNRRRTCRTR